MRPPWLAGVALAVLVGASVASGDPPRAPSPSVHYEISVDAAIETLTARVCFDGSPPASLGAGTDGAARALLDATDERGRALPVVRERIDLSGLGERACMRYRIDLEVARRTSRFGGRVGRDLVTSQGAWLWRDRRGVPVGGATLRFAMPEGIHASVPWPRDAQGAHRLGPSAFQRPGFVAFGHRAARIVRRQGVRARLVRLGDGWNIDDDALAAWLGEAIDGIAGVQGRFPVDDLLVLLVPAPGEGMGFGMIRRGGGYSAMYVVGRDSTPTSLRESWVGWHELSHLHLPALPQEDAWLYEGVATYYQEVIPARLGIQTPTAAWASLVDGFERGARSRATGPLPESSTTMFSTGGFERVYWAGTAFALETDVALRARGRSLDEALRRGGARWRGDLSVWSSERVCALWSGPMDGQVLRPLRDRYTTQRGFPATAPLLARLGVRRASAGVTLEPAELSAVRDAIMSR